MDPDQPLLPGLEPAPASTTDLQRAVRRSIAAIVGTGEGVGEEQAARLALALEMADIIGIKKRTGRLSTVGNDARVLVDLLDKLLPEANAGGGVDEQLAAAMDQWAAMLEGQQQ